MNTEQELLCKISDVARSINLAVHGRVTHLTGK
jgi:hypothetical protein